MKTKKKIFSIIFYTIAAFIIPLPIVGYFYPQIYYPIAGWALSLDKNTSIEFKGYKITLLKGWYFDDGVNDKSIPIFKIPSSLFDYKFGDFAVNFNSNTRTIYAKKEIQVKLKNAKLNEYNFKCIKTYAPNKIPMYFCKPINKPFIILFLNLLNKYDISEVMNDLMKNIKIEKVK